MMLRELLVCVALFTEIVEATEADFVDKPAWS